MLRSALLLLLLSTGCCTFSGEDPPLRPAPDPRSLHGRARRLAAQGRTGESLALLQEPNLNLVKGPGGIPFFGSRFRIDAHLTALKRELARGPLELAPRLIELEPPHPDPLRFPPRPLERR